MAEQTTRKGLREPILEQGIRNTHFFNGRLLTALDLKTEQEANRQQHQQLGQAIGEGVVHGLEVSLIADGSNGGPPVVSVTSGLALNRAGQALALPMTVEVMLAQQSQGLATEAGLFAECTPPKSGTTSTGKGAYIVVATPTSGFREKAPMRGFEENGKVTGCGSRYAVEGVKFRLVELQLHSMSGVSQATRKEIDSLVTEIDNLKTRTDSASLSTLRDSLSKLRSLLAHVCFGTEELANFAEDPLGREKERSPYVTYGALDGLRSLGELTDYDVPLALVYWPTSSVQFVDMWSVRRHLVQPLVGQLWPLHVDQRRLAEAEAMFLQFQHQLDDMLRQENNLASVEAVNRFYYLPPAGYLPIGGRQFSRDKFFHNLNIERVQVDVAFLRLLMHQSWFLEPVDLTVPPPLRIYEAPGHTDYLLFVRRERQPQPTQPDTTPAPAPTPSTGQINIEMDIREALRSSDEIATLFGQGRKPQERLDIKVWVEDELGNEYQAKFIPTESRLLLSEGQKEVEFDRGIAHFTTGALSPGTYKVRVRLKKFKEASRSMDLKAGQTVRVAFKLVPETKKPGKKRDKPKGSGKADWIGPSLFEKIYFMDKYVDWPWPPPELGRVPDLGPVITPPPPEVGVLLQDWADWLHMEYPQAPINPGDMRIYIDPGHVPGDISKDPYAYLVFGDGGAYVPVVLTPADRSLGRSVFITKGNLAGVDRDAQGRLEAVGLTDLDVLGASWTGLVADAMEISLETAGKLITETRDEINDLQASLRIFTGVDAATETALNGLGINNAVDLANANPQDIVAGAGNSLAFARRLVDEAQRVVPESFWSLRAEKLGLNDQEIAALNGLHITTQGTLKTKASDPASRADVENALRLSASNLDSFVAPIDIAEFATEIRETRIGRAPTTSMVGVNRDSAIALAGIGVRNIRALALADVNAVAEVLSGDMGRATNLINAARARINI